MPQIEKGPIPGSTIKFLNDLAGQFRDAGKAYPDLTYHYVMTPTPDAHSPGSDWEAPPPGWCCGIDGHQFTFQGHAGYHGLLEFPIRRYFQSWYSGPGLDEFRVLAKRAEQLLLSLRPRTPLIPVLQALRDRIPDKLLLVRADDPDEYAGRGKKTAPTDIRGPVLLPSGSECWPRFLLILGWKGLPIRVERTTWFEESPGTTVKVDEFEAPAPKDGAFGRFDYERPLRKFRSEMSGVFGRSAYALDWIAENSTLATLGEAPDLSPRKGGGAGHEQRMSPSRKVERGKLDERATAVLMEYPSFSNKQIANMLGCHVKSLSKPEMARFLAARELLESKRLDYKTVGAGRGHYSDDKE